MASAIHLRSAFSYSTAVPQQALAYSPSFAYSFFSVAFSRLLEVLQEKSFELWTRKRETDIVVLRITEKLRIGEGHVIVIADRPAFYVTRSDVILLAEHLSLPDSSVDEDLMLALFAKDNNPCPRKAVNLSQNRKVFPLGLALAADEQKPLLSVLLRHTPLLVLDDGNAAVEPGKVSLLKGLPIAHT